MSNHTSLPSPFGRGAGGEGDGSVCKSKSHLAIERPHPSPLPKGEGTEHRQRTSWHCLAAIGLACCLVMLPDNRAFAADWSGPVSITVQPLPTVDNSKGSSNGTRHGYSEFRVTLKNTALKDLTVELSCGNGGFGYGGSTATRTVRVAAGQETSVSLFQPPRGVHGGLTVQVQYERDPKTIFVSTPFDQSYNESPQFAVLTSRGVPQEFRDPVSAPATGTPVPTPPAAPPGMPGSMPTPPSPTPEPYAFLRSELPVAQWSGSWLSYSSYDVIVVTGQEAEEMPPQAQLAVRRYIECGGTLLVHAEKVPAVFSDGGEPDGSGGHWVGFGRAIASFDGDKNDWPTTRAKLGTASLYEYRPTEKPAASNNLLVAQTTVPVRGLFVLVLVFGIGIGPVNLWFLSRYKRRIWLWWNVPALSLLTCLLVFAYALASEGITGHGRVASLTLLDERCRRATTIGYLSFYCPLTPSVGPQFGVDTDIAPLAMQYEPWRRYEQGGTRIIDWTSNQWLASGWVNARIPAYFQIRKNEDRRERITVEPQADGSVKIVNALGAAIKRLYLADASGRVFEARDIPAGAERTLSTPMAGKTADSHKGLPELHVLFTSNQWLSSFSSIIDKNSAPDSLAPGSYVAILDESPFVERPLEGIESEDTVAIVCGISKGQDNGR